MSACNEGDPGLIPGLERSSVEGNGNPLQHSCLENPMDGGAWQATVHRVAKSQTRLSDFTFTFFLFHFQFWSWNNVPARLYFPRIKEVTSSWPSLPISVWGAKNVLCSLTHRLGSVFYRGGTAKSAGSCQDHPSQRCKWSCVGLRGKAAETISFLHPCNILCFEILKKFLKLFIKIFLRGWPQNNQKMWMIRNLRIRIQVNGQN